LLNFTLTGQEQLTSQSRYLTKRICMHTKVFFMSFSILPSCCSFRPAPTSLSLVHFIVLFYRTLTSLRPLFDILEMATFRAKMNVNCLFVKTFAMSSDKFFHLTFKRHLHTLV